VWVNKLAHVSWKQ